MCNWCKEDAPLKPMVSGAKMPMICSKCGKDCGHWDYKQVRSAMRDSRKHDELAELVAKVIDQHRIEEVITCERTRRASQPCLK
jgi:hypothetical protein